MNSIKKKVVFLDFIMMLPLFILFGVLIQVFFRNSNLEWNYGKLDVIEEKCGNIANRNEEIIKMSNILYLDSEINRLLSKKQELTGYAYVDAQNRIQSKMLELTEVFPSRQYQFMLLCSNGTCFFQSSLNIAKEDLTYSAVAAEDWYQEVDGENDALYFLPKYRSGILEEVFQEDMLFAVRNIRSLNSERHIGIMIIAISSEIWGDSTLDADSEENTIVIDQYQKSIYASDEEMYKKQVFDNSYYQKFNQYTKGFFLGDVGQTYCHIRFAGIPGTDWKYITYTPYRRTQPLYVTLLSALGIAVLTVLIFIVSYNCNFISERMKRLNKNILEVSNGNLKARIHENYEIEFRELCQNFNTMLDRIEDLMKKLEREEEEKHSLEIQALQAQINPHFFYNTLVTIRFMIQMEEYENADKAILAFSKLLRKSFSYTQKIIPVTEELAIAEDYLELMLLRYQNKFQWRVMAEEGARELGILKNVIQPLVENSISHGFNMKGDMGHIVIRVYLENETMIVEVEDDGVGVDLKKINRCIGKQQIPKADERVSEIGLSNIQMRIVRNFGSQYGLKAKINSYGGVTFRMTLPVIPLGGEES